MSTEQDKDSFSLKRNRGGEGGLDNLGGPGLLLGSPDKKRRKSSTQAPPFSPLSEFAPPLNPNSDHLIAANPFDDNYNSPSLKPLPPANPCFAHSHYPGLSGYGPPRMPPHMSNRMPFPYSTPYQVRNQPHHFSRNPMIMGFNQALGFNYRHPENSNYRHRFSGSINNMPLPPGQHFRPGSGENANQIPLQNLNCIPDCGPGFGQEGNGMSPNLSQQQNNFAQSNMPTPKLGVSETVNKNATQNPSPRKQNQDCEESAAQELKEKGRGNTPAAVDRGVEKLNGVFHPNNEALKKSPRPSVDAQVERVRRGSCNSTSALTNNKVLNHPNRRSTLSSSEPMYPCGICLSEVNDDQEAILCEASCQKWFHRDCTGMTEMAYNLLTAETSAVWGCDACMEDKGAQLLKTREVLVPPSVTSEAQS
ncbi:pygopus homolog 1-like isoform X1 [Myxocyprinus asiaticus]|uniref:pygopus homolog 1-like isoform X1 n=1 Tax=Myxocyprinus asiaticus TaxID=70543 RepID=UPI002222628B|nr:pygopus homolog 1-like isoform X1 [Myxocyprinus asiaticus]